MSKLDEEYLMLLKDIIDNGSIKKDRTGTGTISVFGRSIRINLKEGFPLLTTKKMFYKGIIHELLWFLRGDTNIKYLVENNTKIWNDDAYRFYIELVKKHNDFISLKDINPMYYSTMDDMDINTIENVLTEEEFINKVKYCDCQCLIDEIIVEYEDSTVKKYKTKKEFLDNRKDVNVIKITPVINFYMYGDLGPVYGSQWRSFGKTKYDQINEIIKKLKTNPQDRRIILTSYNPDVLDDIALPPCHMMAQFYVNNNKLTNKQELSCFFYCRSQDVPLGTPFNIASYALLTHILANICNMDVGELIYSGGDCHIYLNQLEGVKEQLLRNPYKFDSPKLKINRELTNVDDLSIDDFSIINYESYEKINIPLSVGLKK